MRYLLIFCLMFFIKKSFADSLNLDPKEKKKNGTLCVKNFLEPAVEPNIYFCNLTAHCCTDGREPKCCTIKIAPKIWLNAAYGPIIYFGFFAFLGSLFFVKAAGKTTTYFTEKQIKLIQRFIYGEHYNFKVRDPLFNQNVTRNLDRYSCY